MQPTLFDLDPFTINRSKPIQIDYDALLSLIRKRKGGLVEAAVDLDAENAQMLREDAGQKRSA